MSIRSSFTEGLQHPFGSGLHRINPNPARSIHLSPEPILGSALTAAALFTGTFCFSDTLNSEPRLQEHCGMPELTLWATLSWLHKPPLLGYFILNNQLEFDFCDSLTFYVSSSAFSCSYSTDPGSFCSSLSHCVPMAQDPKAQCFWTAVVIARKVLKMSKGNFYTQLNHRSNGESVRKDIFRHGKTQNIYLSCIPSREATGWIYSTKRKE